MVPSHPTGMSFCPGKFSDDIKGVKSTPVVATSSLQSVSGKEGDREITKIFSLAKCKSYFSSVNLRQAQGSESLNSRGLKIFTGSAALTLKLAGQCMWTELEELLVFTKGAWLVSLHSQFISVISKYSPEHSLPQSHRTWVRRDL